MERVKGASEVDCDKPAQSLRYSTKTDLETALRRLSTKPEQKSVPRYRERSSVQNFFQCQPCKDDAQNVTAVVFCQNCRKYMCQECKKADEKLNRGKNRHTIIPVVPGTTEKSQAHNRAEDVIQESLPMGKTETDSGDKAISETETRLPTTHGFNEDPDKTKIDATDSKTSIHSDSSSGSHETISEADTGQQLSAENENIKITEISEEISCTKTNSEADTEQQAMAEYENTKTAERSKGIPGTESITLVKKIDIRKRKTELECDISDIACLPNGDMVLTDMKNECLKFITPNSKIRIFKLDSWPWNLAMSSLNDNDVYITIPDRRKIILINADECLTMADDLVTSGDCWGIACITEGLIVSIWDEGKRSGCIQMLDFEGEVQVTLENEAKRESFLNGSCYLTVNQSETMLFVTDNESKAVNFIELNGNSLTTRNVFRRNHFGYVCGVAVDARGNVYVVDIQNKCLYELRKESDGTYLETTILSQADGLALPRCVYYNKSNDSIYIGGYTDFVRVYSHKKM